MNYISGADIVRATGGNIPPVSDADPDRRMMVFLWIKDCLRNAGLVDQVEDALMWNCWPNDFEWMHEACSDLSKFNSRCRQLGWPTGLAGIKHKQQHSGEWSHHSHLAKDKQS